MRASARTCVQSACKSYWKRNAVSASVNARARVCESDRLRTRVREMIFRFRVRVCVCGVSACPDAQVGSVRLRSGTPRASLRARSHNTHTHTQHAGRQLKLEFFGARTNSTVRAHDQPSARAKTMNTYFYGIIPSLHALCRSPEFRPRAARGPFCISHAHAKNTTLLHIRDDRAPRRSRLSLLFGLRIFGLFI